MKNHRLYAWLLTVIAIIAMAIMVVLFDIREAGATRRECTTFTYVVLSLVLVQQACMLGGGWLLYKHMPELEQLQNASVENLSLKTKLMFTEQQNLSMTKALLNDKSPAKESRPWREMPHKPQQNPRRAAPGASGPPAGSMQRLTAS